jgi:hypothetical protein
MMHNDNNVCFDCRVTFKQGSTCPHCGNHLVEVSHIWRLPKKSDIKGWEKTKQLIFKCNTYAKIQYSQRTLKHDKFHQKRF